MAGSWIGVGGVLLAMSLTAGCGADREVEDVESVLVESYLEPLEAAGITASVESACRYAGPVDALWHLRVRLRLDASSRRVADVLHVS